MNAAPNGGRNDADRGEEGEERAEGQGADRPVAEPAEQPCATALTTMLCTTAVSVS